MKTEQIKCCPFCGCEARQGQNYLGQYVVMCQNEDCGAAIFSENRCDVIRKWNTRKEENT